MFMSVTLTGISPPARNRWGWPLSALSIDGRRNHDLHSLSGGALGKLLHPTSDETAGGQFAHDQFLSRYLPPAAAVRPAAAGKTSLPSGVGRDRRASDRRFPR